MQDNKINLPQNIYADHLQVINGVRFTRREIDSLACLLNGRTAKTTAAFLSISPRTVEAHTYNIMGKLGCNAQDGIRDFIEKSGKFSVVKEHYASLLIQAVFEQSLQKILALADKDPSMCLFVYDKALEQKAPFFYQLEKHLEAAGIQTISAAVASDKFMAHPTHIGNQSVDYVIYAVSHDLLTQLHQGEVKAKLEISYVLQRAKEAPHSVIFLLLNMETTANVPEEIRNVGYVKFDAPEDYYFLVFELLERILPNIDLTKIISEFKNQYKTIYGSFETTPSQMGSDVNKSLQEEQINNGPSILKKGKSWLLLGLACLSAICFLFLTFNETTQDKSHLGKGIRTTQSVRSDLPLPTSNALLNRPELIAQIDKKLKGGPGIKAVALVGIGGCGKTTTARQYARSQKVPVVWEINAESKESLINSFENLAYVLSKTSEEKKNLKGLQDIKDPQERKEKILFFVKERLKIQPNWLLIYDNVENFTNIQKCFPSDENVWGIGKVILTSRDNTIQNNSHINNAVRIAELAPQEKLDLFIKIMSNEKTHQLTALQKEQARKFLTHIPPFPLDVSIAAYYLKDTQISYGKYLTYFENYHKDFANLQENILKGVSDYTKTRYNIITLSLNRLIETNKNFGDLLLFISLLDSQNISKSLLDAYKSEVVVDDFIYNLKKYSLITSQFSPSSQSALKFSIHRSTQEISLTFLLNYFNETEKRAFLDKMLVALKSVYKVNLRQNGAHNLLLLTHLNALKENLKNIGLSKELKEKYEIELLYMLGNINYKLTNNRILSRKYFLEVLELNKSKQFLSNITITRLLLDLGESCIYSGKLKEGREFCRECAKICITQKGYELLLAESLDLTGVSYSQENNFEKSKEYFEKALHTLTRVEQKLRTKIEAGIYKHLSWLYSKTYMNKPEASNAIKYAYKALDIFNASHVFYKTHPEIPIENLKEIVRYKEGLGYSYCRMGKYKEAYELGFRDAQYIINHLLNKKYHFVLKGYIYLGIGEVFLRKGNLTAAENYLSKSIQISDKLVGGCDALQARIYRAETRIRLGKLVKAYEDCLSVFQMEKTVNHHYFNLMNCICFYHAAIIKLKQGDLKKSMEHFNEFLQNIDIFCKVFLNKEDYENLKIKGVFNQPLCKNNQAKHNIELYLKKCIEIFSTIYGPFHPFLKEYVKGI